MKYFSSVPYWQNVFLPLLITLFSFFPFFFLFLVFLIRLPACFSQLLSFFVSKRYFSYYIKTGTGVERSRILRQVSGENRSFDLSSSPEPVISPKSSHPSSDPTTSLSMSSSFYFFYNRTEPEENRKNTCSNSS